MSEPHAQPASDASKKRRRVRAAAFVFVVVCAIGALIYVSVQSIRQAEREGSLRDVAAAVRSEEAFRRSGGAIKVYGKDSDLPFPYNWNGGSKILSVTVTLGTCQHVDGYFKSPAAPKSPQDMSDLVLIVPGISEHTEPAHVSVTSPQLYETLINSSLKHCVAGDKRLMPQ